MMIPSAFLSSISSVFVLAGLDATIFTAPASTLAFAGVQPPSVSSNFSSFAGPALAVVLVVVSSEPPHAASARLRRRLRLRR